MSKAMRYFMGFVGAFDIGWGLYNLITGSGSWFMAHYYMFLVALGIFFIYKSLK